MKEYRKVVKIDEELCDGCGLCVPSCAEGAIRVIDGKARLVSEVYCDGLGACLGECPQGAITVEERPAEAFDDKAVAVHLGKAKVDAAATTDNQSRQAAQEFSGCPGSLSQMFEAQAASVEVATERESSLPQRSSLANWPVQLKLAPLKAPYFDQARLLVSADCAAFASGDFHSRYLEGRTLLIGCPKLDDVELYLNKLKAIFEGNEILSVDVLYMEAPCCGGLVHIVQRAMREAGRNIPLRRVRIGFRGDTLEDSGTLADVKRAEA